MKQSAARIRPLLLLSGAALAVLVLLLWSGGGGEQTARANPELTVGIDLNPNTPSTYESCMPIGSVGAEFEVDVFVLDVVDLMAFSADLEYDGSVLDVIAVDTEDVYFLGGDAAPASTLLPRDPGSSNFTVGAFDFENQGHDGSGVLGRLTLKAVGNGVSPFNIDNLDIDGDTLLDRGVLLQDSAIPPNPIGDTSVPPDTFFDGPFINEETTIAVGGAGADTDNDGFIDACDNCPNVANDQTDTDSDTDPNNPNMYPSPPITDTGGDACDTDDDNDGIPDSIPPGPDNCRLIPNPFDADGDGQDGEDPYDLLDNDADTLVDEDHEIGQENWNDDFEGDVCDDSDGDTVMDYPDNCREIANDQTDTDVDGVGDLCDPDKDGDGVLQDGDGSGLEDDNFCTGGETANCDDNCPDRPNSDQADADGVPPGDVCQDSDSDGWYDLEDNCPTTHNQNQADGGQGGEVPVDGVGDLCDNCEYDYNPGQENSDTDVSGDACDPDDDNDGLCDPGETSAFCTGSDNCQLIANGPSQSGDVCVGNQTDTNGDLIGDPCDPNADSDFYPKALEEGYGSKDCDASSTPEVCNGADSDGDTLTDEGPNDPERPGDPPTPFTDSDTDTVPDCVDSNVNTDGQGPYNCLETGDSDGDGVADCLDVDADSDGDTIPDPKDPDAGDPDDDGDGTPDVDEGIILTDSLVGCHNGIGYPDWPSDFDDNYTINILDVNMTLPPIFASTMGDPDYDIRQDLKPDGVINILDVNMTLPPIFGSVCTP